MGDVGFDGSGYVVLDGDSVAAETYRRALEESVLEMARGLAGSVVEARGESLYAVAVHHGLREELVREWTRGRVVGR